MTEKTEQKIAIVTGASKGIGLEITKALIRDGYLVYGLARSDAGSKAMPEDCAEKVRWRKCDVSDSENVHKVFEEIFDEAGKADVLICNAGIGISGSS